MYQKKESKWLKHLDFIVLDFLCMEISYITCYMVRMGTAFTFADVEYRNMSIIQGLIYLVVVFFNESYSGILRRGYFKEFAATLKQVTYIMMLTLAYLFVTKQSTVYSRLIVFGMWGLYILLSYITRLLWKTYLGKYRFKQDGKRSLFLVTSSDMAQEVVRTILRNNFDNLFLHAIAIIDTSMKGQEILGVPVVADQESLIPHIQKEWVDEVFFNLSSKTVIPTAAIQCCAEMGVTVHVKLEKLEILGGNQEVEKFAGYTVLSSNIKIASPRDMFLKRTMDVIGGLVGVLLTSLIFIVIGPIIKIKSPGPIFFSQIRVGKNGRKFKIYKFRSMYEGAEERKKELMTKNKVQDGFMFKMEDDPRIIKGIGSFIRKTSLDEFPQFLNVLKGDMSLVGTRPPTVDEWEKYEMHHRKRLSIRPGITGLWQVSGRSEVTDFEEVVALDTQYITNWTLGMDFRILWKTVLIVLTGKGAM